MTANVRIEVESPLLAKVVVEVWQRNHIMGEHRRVSSFYLNTSEMDVFKVWPEQYLIVRQAVVGEQI